LNLIIHSDKSGTYTFSLIINDHKNGIIEKQIQIHSLYGYPFVDLEQTFFQYMTEDLVEIDLSPSNQDEGPFTYDILHALPGMAISDSGIFTWQIAAQDYYFPGTTVEITALVSNADNEVEVPLSFSISSTDDKHPVVHIGIKVPNKERNIHVGDFDNDGITEILLTNNENLIYSLEWQEERYVQDWIYPYAINSSTNLIDAILPIDTDGDGQYEIFVQTGSQIKVIDMNANTITASFDLSHYLATATEFGKGIASADLDNNGSMELVALCGDEFSESSSVAFVIDAASLDPLWHTPVREHGDGIGIGNVDNDSALEIVTPGGYVYDGSTREVEWIYTDQFGIDIIVADVTGNGIDEIIAYEKYANPTVYDAITKSEIFSFPDSIRARSIVAANLDNDPEKEIIIGNYPSWDLTAYDADSGFAVEIWSVKEGVGGGVGLAVGDTDQDGNPEVIWGTGHPNTSHGKKSLVVFDLVNQTIDFHNSDVIHLDSPYIGGRPIINSSGEKKVVFAVAETNGGFSGSGLLSMDLDTGALAISPDAGSDSPDRRFDFCVADYDLDDTEEVLFFSGDHYDRSFYVYDLFRADEEMSWPVITDGTMGYIRKVSCGDANGDGHTDLATVWGSGIRLYDPFNQLLIWSSSQSTTNRPSRVEVLDLDGDSNPEILARSGHKLTVYTQSGNSYIEDNEKVYTYDGGLIRDMIIADIDGDLEPEIVISLSAYDQETDNIQLVVLDKDLRLKKYFTIPGNISAMANTGTGNNTLLIATSADGDYRIKLIDLQSQTTIWKSPPLLGRVFNKSFHIIQKPGSSKKQLAIGTLNAILLMWNAIWNDAQRTALLTVSDCGSG